MKQSNGFFLALKKHVFTSFLSVFYLHNVIGKCVVACNQENSAIKKGKRIRSFGTYQFLNNKK